MKARKGQISTIYRNHPQALKGKFQVSYLLRSKVTGVVFAYSKRLLLYSRGDICLELEAVVNGS